MSSIQLWVDCDAGVDDAQALMLCHSQTNVTCVGISCVFGNVGVKQVGRNVARISKLCGKEDIPIYIGAEEPLLAEPQECTWFHGRDGLGDVPGVSPSTSEVRFKAAPGHAVVKLVDAARRSQGNLLVVALGPLTNIALAIKLDPDFPSRIRQLVVMGGAEAMGNTTPTAEYNFHTDPEAARIVLSKCPGTTLVSWECAQRHPVPHSLLDEWKGMHSAKAQFLMSVMGKSLQVMKKRYPDAGWWACDSVAMAVALRPDLVVESRNVWGQVEIDGSPLVKGMLVLDWHDKLKNKANIDLIVDIKLEPFLDMLTSSIEGMNKATFGNHNILGWDIAYATNLAPQTSWGRGGNDDDSD